MKPVIVTNGYPGSGKDEFARQLGKYVRVYRTSIIDFAKDITQNLGIDGEKNARYRELLYRLKSLFDWYNDYPFRDMSELVEQYRYAEPIWGWNECDALVIDIRDPEQIERAKREWNAITVYIESPNSKRFDNPADNDVEDFDYDYYIYNPGDESFNEVVRRFKERVFDRAEATLD